MPDQQVFVQQLCDERHEDLDRRMDVVEKSLNENLQKVYSKFDEVSQAMMHRLPPWVTFAMTGLGTLCGGLIVALLSKR